jgi:glutamate racemase
LTSVPRGLLLSKLNTENLLMIGVFDSGFGGLVVLREFLQVLPLYDYLYLGDNARIPYGTRSDRVVYRFTEQAVEYLFRQGCRLIILACHTASAKALRTIQQVYLPAHYPERRVLGVVIPTVEEAISRSPGRCIGVIATEGTVDSRSFELELHKLDPGVQVVQQACPLLVPLIESGEQDWEGTTMILRRYLAPLRASKVDALILGCTHYSILKEKITAVMGDGVALVCSGEVAAAKLVDYLKRHPEIEGRLSRGGGRRFLTTDLTPRFQMLASLFMGQPVDSEVVEL